MIRIAERLDESAVDRSSWLDVIRIAGRLEESIVAGSNVSPHRAGTCAAPVALF